MIKYGHFLDVCSRRGLDGEQIILHSLEKQAGLGTILRTIGKSVKSAPGKLKNWFSPVTLQHIHVPSSPSSAVANGAYGSIANAGSAALDVTSPLRKFRWDRLLALLGAGGATGTLAYSLAKGNGQQSNSIGQKFRNLSPEAKRALIIAGLSAGGIASAAAIASAFSKPPNRKPRMNPQEL